MVAFPKHSCGSITLVALSLAIVIGISLASYIALCQQSLQLSTRTVVLGKARQLAETGLEEALWSLNAYANPDPTIQAVAWTSTVNSAATAVTWDSNAPLTAADKHCVISGYDLGQGATGQIDITIINYNGPTTTPAVPAPKITVTANVSVPGLGNFSRTLTATARPAPLFPNALGISRSTSSVSPGSTYAVIFKSGGLVDSWDSDYLENATPHRDYNALTPNTTYPGTSAPTSPATTLPSPYSSIAAPTNQYPTAAFNYAAVVAAPNIILNNAEIRGYAATNGNPINITGGSKVTAPPLPGTPPTPPNIQATRVSKSAFVPSFTIGVPSGNSGNLPPTYSTGDTPLSGGVWYAPSGLEVDGTAPPGGATLTISQPTVIIVQGDLWLHHAGRIKIAGSGRLEIFVQGNFTVGPHSASTAGFQNDTNEPKNLIVYCTGASRTFQYQSTRDFCGVIYSSSTSSRIQFLISSPDPVIFGAILAKYNIEFDPGTYPKIHYDTALQYLPKGWFKGVTTPFMLEQVTESILP